jgi:acyl-CoA synthetase (AMP-forming)/AMP-acid ligase II
MRERLNDFARATIGAVLTLAGWAAWVVFAWRVWRFESTQRRLRARHAIGPETPIQDFDGCRPRIEAVRRALGPRALEASTSGSTRAPKKLVYTRQRLAETHLVFSETLARWFVRLGVRRMSFFVFSPMSSDSSLTSLMLEEKRSGWLLCLQTPHRVQAEPVIKKAAAKYGDTAVRLWILAVTNPGMLYATNPSTLATFFHELFSDWDRSRRLVRDAFEQPALFDAALASLQRRVCARGARERLERIARAAAPLSVEEMFPGLAAYCCWDGGYVQSFLEQVRKRLPPSRYQFIPMYSMSTETIETVSGIGREGPYFLPIAPGVLYEFLPESAEDRPEHLLKPSELQPGQLYSMVVSDGYGLSRYQTEDLFRCERRVGRLPDLRFVRRRNLSYSFTGEKLTGQQLSEALAVAQREVSSLRNAGFLTCLPAHPAGAALPHYKVVLISDLEAPQDSAQICAVVQQQLCEMNAEFAAKIASRRLGSMEFASIPIREFVRKVGGEAAAQTWESQFKFLPLYAKRWEEL